MRYTSRMGRVTIRGFDLEMRIPRTRFTGMVIIWASPRLLDVEVVHHAPGCQGYAGFTVVWPWAKAVKTYHSGYRPIRWEWVYRILQFNVAGGLA